MANVPHQRTQRHSTRIRSSHDHAGYLAPLMGGEAAADQSSIDDIPQSPVIITSNGGTPGFSLDFTAPEAPTGLALSSDYGTDADGRSILRLIATLTHPGDVDLFASYVEVTADNDGNPDPALVAPTWTNPATILIGSEATYGAIEGVRGNTQYWARAYSVDVTGNKSEYTSEVSVVTGKDTVAPGQPTGFVVAAGFRGIGAHWNASIAPDLMFYELRYAPDDGTGTGPDTNSWTTLRVRTSTVWIDNLTIDQLYWLQVRAVDFSGNVEDATWTVTGLEVSNVITTSADHGLAVGDTVVFGGLTGGVGLTDGTVYYVLTTPAANTLTVSDQSGGAVVDFTTDITDGSLERSPNVVDYQAFPENGWTTALSATPSAIGAADVAFNSVLTNILAANSIDADTIETGILRIDTGDSAKADGIRIFDGAVLVGFWDETGLYIGDTTAGIPLDPDDTIGDLSASDYIHLTNAGLTVYLDGTAQTAINTEGINASAINFGSLPGGHNLLKNSSFELADFAAAASAVDWNATADFAATDLSSTNVTNTDNVAMTGVTF